MADDYRSDTKVAVPTETIVRPSTRTFKIRTFKFAVEHGTHPLVSHPPPHPRANAAAGTFTGLCFACGGPGHSQNKCPLKQCARCKMWGHGDGTCLARGAGEAAVGDGGPSHGFGIYHHHRGRGHAGGGAFNARRSFGSGWARAKQSASGSAPLTRNTLFISHHLQSDRTDPSRGYTEQRPQRLHYYATGGQEQQQRQAQ